MQPRHRNPVAGRPYVRSDKHQMVRQAVVDQLSASGPGRTSEDLVAALAPQLPLSLFPTFASVRRFLTAVRIDLQARGLVTRVGRTRPARYLLAPA